MDPNVWQMVTSQLQNITDLLQDFKSDQETATHQEQLSKLHKYTTKGKKE